MGGLYSRTYLENQMCVTLGGRIAEELIFGAEDATTGASNDFQQVSRTAKMMITQAGFSENLAPVALSGGGGQSFLGNDMGQQAEYSMETADKFQQIMLQSESDMYLKEDSPETTVPFMQKA